MLTKLRRAHTIDRSAGPVVGPCNIAVLAESNHGLNGKGHTSLAFANRLVLGIMRNVGRAMEELVDTVTAVCSDDTALLLRSVLLDNVAKLADQNAGLNSLDRLFQALTRGLNNANIVSVRLGLLADIVRLVQIGMVAFVIQCNINVENITVNENALVGDTVANDFVNGGTARLGEVVVVERRRVGLAEHVSGCLGMKRLSRVHIPCARYRPCVQSRRYRR